MLSGARLSVQTEPSGGDQDFDEWFAVALVAVGEVIWTARKNLVHDADF